MKFEINNNVSEHHKVDEVLPPTQPHRRKSIIFSTQSSHNILQKSPTETFPPKLIKNGLTNLAFEKEGNFDDDSDYYDTVTSFSSIATTMTECSDEGYHGNGGGYDFDVVLEEIGGMGKYQMLLIVLVYAITIPAGVLHNAPIFLAARPPFRCSLGELDEIKNFNLTEQQLKELFIPMNKHTHDYDQCKRYDYNLSACNDGSLDCIANKTTKTISCDQGYWYDTSVYEDTLVTEFDLVCGETILGAVVTSSFFLGVFISSLFSDENLFRYGRIPVMLLTVVGISALGVASAFVGNYIGFAVLRFLIGVFLQIGYYTCTVYVYDITSVRWRDCIGSFVQLVFARTLIGYVCLSGFAFVWREWRHLQFFISFVPFPFIALWFFIPESPRWLFDHGKNSEAKKICERMIKRNGKVFSDDLWEKAKIKDKFNYALDDNEVKESNSIKDLFKHRKMRLITYNISICWFVNSMVYFGLSMNASSLSGSDFLNNALNALVEFPAYGFIVLSRRKVQRKTILCTCMIVAGVCCLASTLVKIVFYESILKEDIVTAFVLFGKMFISASFAIISSFTAEIYPTTVRSKAVRFGASCGRIGSIIAPFVICFQYALPYITTVVFGILAVFAGLLAIWFPETLGKKMPDSTEDAEKFYNGEKELESYCDEEKSDGFWATRF